MLRVKRIVCLISFIALFNSYNTSIITPFNALATDVVKDNNVEIINKNKEEFKETPNDIQYEKMSQKELATNTKEKIGVPEEKNYVPEWKEYILTFYTSLQCENSSAGAVTCQNKPLIPGGVANNVIPQNTKIYLEGYGQVIVNDKGSDRYFSIDNRLDVFVERNLGESDKQYSQRVNSYGVQRVKGYIIK